MASSSTRRGFGLIDALDAEWDELARVHQEVVARWSGAHEALGDCADLGDVLLAIRALPDAVLRALLTETTSSHGPESSGTLAARTILQAMLGKVVRMASRDRDGDVGPWVSAMWWQICTYPLTQRPARIAANLALDTLKAVRAEQGWSPCITLAEPSPGLGDAHDRAHREHSLDHQGEVARATAEGVLAAAGRLGVVSERSQRLLYTVYVSGLSGVDAAARHRSTPGSVRVRCSRAIRQLAQAAPQLADAL